MKIGNQFDFQGNCPFKDLTYNGKHYSKNQSASSENTRHNPRTQTGVCDYC